MKKKLLISFSGGETSAYMGQWLWKHKQDEYEMIFVFANTAQENEETYNFIERCSKQFGFPIVWIEGITNQKNGIGQSFKVVNFNSANREGEPFENVISKYGIPNIKFPHCTRELKERPIGKYAKSIGWTDYYTAIGIRSDEADRMNSKAKLKRFIYPLISDVSMTKPKINFWWSQQPFRLNLKGYQGNCVWCWKKANIKLFQIAKEKPSAFDFPKSMEDKYGDYVPETRLDKNFNLPINFFRGNRSTVNILEDSIKFNKKVYDDSVDMNFQLDLIGGDSCEIYAECN